MPKGTPEIQGKKGTARARRGQKVDMLNAQNVSTIKQKHEASRFQDSE
jgi:hypothetical protein